LFWYYEKVIPKRKTSLISSLLIKYSKWSLSITIFKEEGCRILTAILTATFIHTSYLFFDIFVYWRGVYRIYIIKKKIRSQITYLEYILWYMALWFKKKKSHYCSWGWLLLMIDTLISIIDPMSVCSQTLKTSFFQYILDLTGVLTFLEFTYSVWTPLWCTFNIYRPFSWYATENIFIGGQRVSMWKMIFSSLILRKVF